MCRAPPPPPDLTVLLLPSLGNSTPTPRDLLRLPIERWLDCWTTSSGWKYLPPSPHLVAETTAARGTQSIFELPSCLICMLGGFESDAGISNASCTPTCTCADLYFSVHARTKIGCSTNRHLHARMYFLARARWCE